MTDAILDLRACVKEAMWRGAREFLAEEYGGLKDAQAHPTFLREMADFLERLDVALDEALGDG